MKQQQTFERENEFISGSTLMQIIDKMVREEVKRVKTADR